VANFPLNSFCIRNLFSAAAIIALAATAQSQLRAPIRAIEESQAAKSHVVKSNIDESQSVTLPGNVHPLARPEYDEGLASADTKLSRMLLLLAPSPTQQAELDALLAEQQNPASSLYHRWLTPAEYGALFGASAQNIARVTAWLRAHGFSIDEIPPGNRLIVFSGNVAQVSDAFHTEIHRYRVDGVSHLANSQDSQIPAALNGVVAGVVTLHDFARQSEIKQPEIKASAPLYSAGSTHYLFPADLAAIYNLNPLYNEGSTGSSATIAIAGRSNIALGDVAQFRSLAGLAANTPAVVLDGVDPGLVSGDQMESTLDVEWAGAVAPAASVSLVAAASTSTTDGIDLASAYIVNHIAAQVVSVSYGTCEQQMGATELAFYNSLWQQAASQGMSVFVAAGDAGAADCNAPTSSTANQAAVNGLCSSPYATCVGGTEFSEGSNPAQYWSSANSAGYGSAFGYIPEVVWNESAANGGAGLWASGGGASAIYAQPAWQASVEGAGAANGMRAVPDVSLSAADHDGYMIYENGAPHVISGTSAAAPSFAAIMALIAARAGKGQGSANPQFYSLAAGGSSPFHATPSGDNSVPGVSGHYANGAVYNLATGLGSVDASALAGGWVSKGAPPTLALASQSSQASLIPRGSVAVSFTVATGGAFTGPIALSVTGLGSGVTASWSANPIANASGVSSTKVELTLAASAQAAQGSFNLTVSASGDGVSSTKTIVLEVQQSITCLSRLQFVHSPCSPPAPIRRLQAR
jgi:subtilase family serine protease